LILNRLDSNQSDCNSGVGVGGVGAASPPPKVLTYEIFGQINVAIFLAILISSCFRGATSSSFQEGGQFS